MYTPTIGLEIHTELKTRAKMFCGCLNIFSNNPRIKSNESRIVLKDESYKLMGLLFEIHKKLGPIYKERNYQDAIEEILKREKISYEREKKISLKFENLEVSDFFVDFVIDNKILLEIKAKNFITQDDIRQGSRYIKSLSLPLAIVVNFKKQKLEYKRIVNPVFENNSSSFEENSGEPNVNICPVCLAHPGVLPVINKKAVEAVLKLGLALNSQIPETSKFDRKNYFYPDLPKSYQISQYDKPLVVGGELIGVKITRVHLEEDTARLVHSPDGKSSLVDFNRAGVPLMELVTEPVIKSGKEAVAFAKELQLIMRYLGISDADMEKGQMRIEANISVAKDGELGTKVEIKNLNSFRSVGESIDYEIKRQEEMLEGGGKVIHETRGWDENKKATFSQRAKEEAHDYRYFPEPDLPIIFFSNNPRIKSNASRIFENNSSLFEENSGNFIDLKKLKAEIPELPVAKRQRFMEEYKLSSEQADALVSEPLIAEYFEESMSELLEELSERKEEWEKGKAITLLFNYLTSDIKGIANEKGISVKEVNITPENFADLIVLIGKGEITSRIAKDILREMFLTGLDPQRIIKEKGLTKISEDDIIRQTIDEVINENFDAVEDYKNGKGNAIQFLIGQAMKKLKGRTNPEVLKELLKNKL